MPVKPSRFYLLDIVRGLASLAVVIFHYSYFPAAGRGAELVGAFSQQKMPFYSLLWPLYVHGSNAVELFFVLSGFVFFMLYLDQIKDRKIGAWDFSALRFSRLYPLHFVTLILTAVILTQVDWGGCSDAYHFVLNLFFVSHWGFQRCENNFNSPVWSVSAEVLLYIVFFFVATLAPKAVTPRFAIVLAFMIAGIAGTIYLGDAHSRLARAMFCFYAGGGAYLVLRELLARGIQPALIASVSLGVIVAAGLWLYCDGRHVGATLHGIIFPTLVLGLAATQYISVNAGHKLRVIGDITYATYLTHVPLQMIVVAVAGLVTIDYYSPVTMFLFLALVIAVSVPTYYYFEKPAQDYLRSHFTAASTY